MPHRYFTTEISNGTATLRGADAHHLSRVIRGKLGDTQQSHTEIPPAQPPTG